MNCSANCGRELKTDLDKFGSIESPVCFQCFISGAELNDEVIKERIEYERLRERVDEIENEIDQLESEKNDLEERIHVLERKPGIALIHTDEKLSAWVSGFPMRFS